MLVSVRANRRSTAGRATFQWIAPSNFTLSQLQAIIVKKLNLENFQVQFDYTRNPYKTQCSIYRVTILEEDWRLSEVLHMFNVEQRKFRADKEFECGIDLSTTETDLASSSVAVLFIPCHTILLYLWGEI
ncbi:hypothetical protein RB195_024800 [Necator americanus]|uniref:Uncharacterized protein n=1 Tax=Necator americanus TaxID=51031 RepID=A0ABR1EQ81_NECAM